MNNEIGDGIDDSIGIAIGNDNKITGGLVFVKTTAVAATSTVALSLTVTIIVICVTTIIPILLIIFGVYITNEKDMKTKLSRFNWIFSKKISIEELQELIDKVRYKKINFDDSVIFLLNRIREKHNKNKLFLYFFNNDIETIEFFKDIIIRKKHTYIHSFRFVRHLLWEKCKSFIKTKYSNVKNRFTVKFNQNYFNKINKMLETKKIDEVTAVAANLDAKTNVMKTKKKRHGATSKRHGATSKRHGATSKRHGAV
jgi:hypothetical protein